MFIQVFIHRERSRKSLESTYVLCANHLTEQIPSQLVLLCLLCFKMFTSIKRFNSRVRHWTETSPRKHSHNEQFGFISSRLIFGPVQGCAVLCSSEGELSSGHSSTNILEGEVSKAPWTISPKEKYTKIHGHLKRVSYFCVTQACKTATTFYGRSHSGFSPLMLILAKFIFHSSWKRAVG